MDNIIKSQFINAINLLGKIWIVLTLLTEILIKLDDNDHQ